ncbi:MAG: Eco57I restriction-modification methylase domain-containing protein [Actinomycetota bacterium]|nr:Eco57I restriction-modification methylase domain-containing protein [Actinomycetota bacterium]MDA8196992.1 Eco57I restriction-modification methylase domain-containing protein [Actinomycetota bacterium]
MQSKQPDILEVIANLSNDAIFTPPRVVNAVLDLLPDEVWTDPTLRWLDPGAKTGVFPREITKRLMVGLVDAIPDEDARLHHILTNMVFAIATEEITGMMTRRSLYCSKDASSEFSVVRFATPAGNVWQKRVKHSWDSEGKCTECKGTKAQLLVPGRDNKAYGFIHADGRTQINKELNMKFDVIVGNPPYQMDADSEGQNVVPIYDTFVREAIELNPRFVSMIIPSRWLAGGKWLDGFRDQMLADTRIRKIADFPVASELFPGVEIKGGVMYFLWDGDNPGACETTMRRGDEVIGPTNRQLDKYDVFVRDARALPVLEKVIGELGVPFAELVSTRDPFGPALSSNFTKFRQDDVRRAGDLKLYMNLGSKRVEKWVDPSLVTRNHAVIEKWKVFIPNAGSDGGQRLPDVVLGTPLIAEPSSVCTLTYLFIGPFDTETEARSVDSYIRTRFARFLVSLRKISQHTTRSSYNWVPQQTWDRTWTDAELYEKYGITPEEQAYIESTVKEMPA